MNNHLRRILILLILFGPLSLHAAELVYVDDKVLVGMHQNEDLDTAIIKTVPSGTPLEMVQRGSSMSLVKDPDGVRGWIDNRYLTGDPPAQVSLQLAEEKITRLETDLSRTKNKLADYEKFDADKNNTEQFIALNKENEDLKKLLKSERVRIGQLQGEIDNLRHSLNENNKTAGLLEQIDVLTEKNNGLQKEIEELNKTIAAMKRTRTTDSANSGWKTVIVVLFLSLLSGIAIGLYVMDLYIRRRHGGFRV